MNERRNQSMHFFEDKMEVMNQATSWWRTCGVLKMTMVLLSDG